MPVYVFLVHLANSNLVPLFNADPCLTLRRAVDILPSDSVASTGIHDMSGLCLCDAHGGHRQWDVVCIRQHPIVSADDPQQRVQVELVHTAFVEDPGLVRRVDVVFVPDGAVFVAWDCE